MDKRSVLSRFWVYQGERFPLLKNGSLIAAFASSAVCLSSLLRDDERFPGPASLFTAFFILLGFFALLRIADEFKDRDTDAKYRPERAVPRGLVTLGELAILGGLIGILQLALTVLFHPPLVVLLFLVWAYMGLMTVEFFAAEWLRASPFAYMTSHMAIMPLIDFFATATDWLPAKGWPPHGLVWFLVLSFFNGLGIEIGRKTWAPSMEREGVESYSSHWGIAKALLFWLGALAFSLGLAIFVASQIDFVLLPAVVLLVMGGLAVILAVRFAMDPDEAGARKIDVLSGLWVFSTYLLLGLLPMVGRAWF
ncbi:MAG: UbiA family prenyltransferase [Kiloniellales bacterium]|nr:UbiA family prenyltransferase [Kiloniellales bacterium]